LKVADCSKDLSNYNMQPSFFSAMTSGPTNNQLLIRIQPGGYSQEYEDSLTISINDRASIAAMVAAADGGAPVPISLETPPGSEPGVPPPQVQMVLSLRGTCGPGQYDPSDLSDVTLDAVSGNITFTSMLSGDPYSSDTNSKRIAGHFENVAVQDPRNPTATYGTITGDFRFFFQVGAPAQPFP
jgi:hypothetical protein